MYATQVACLNDSTEIRYASKLFRDAVTDLRKGLAEDHDAADFLDKVVQLVSEQPNIPSHSPSRFFVVCFSAEEDDLSQWRAYGEQGGENGYALGMKARGLVANSGSSSVVIKVNYDPVRHKELAKSLAEATLRFYREGIEQNRAETPEAWALKFLNEWDE